MAKENFQIYIECTLYILKEHQQGIYRSLSLRIAMIQYDDGIQSDSMSYLYYRKWRRYSARPQCILVECGPLRLPHTSRFFVVELQIFSRGQIGLKFVGPSVCRTSHFWSFLPFSLIRDFGKQNTRGNVSKISVSLTCYRQIGSKSTNHSPLAWRKEGQKVTLVAVIGGFRSDLSIIRMTGGNFGNVSAGVLFSKVACQRKRW